MKQKTIRCPYCHSTAILRKAIDIYGDKAIEEHVYVCSKFPICNSYVGVHLGTTRPKGSLANGDLRNKRIQAHRIFDAIWKQNIMSRKNAYRWIQDRFSLSHEQAHIGNFSDFMCDQLIMECQRVLKNNKIAC